MEIHKPKPVHSWRELATEIGVIVIGVAIALAGEQTVEALHNRDRAVATRDAIRAEIAGYLGTTEQRRATEPCVTTRLDEIGGLIAAEAAGKPLPAALWIGRPANYPVRDSQYRSATQSGSFNLLGDREQADYAAVYASFATYWQAATDELKAWADLRTLEQHPPPSPVLDWQLRSALQQARNSRWLVESNRQLALNAAKEAGIQPAKLRLYKPQSVCIPLNTARDVALKLVIQGRPGNYAYDEP